MDFSQAIQFSAQLLSGGRFADAQTVCEQIIKKVPNHAEAHHLLGLALHRQSRSAEGVQYIQKAIELEPEQLGFHMNLGHVLRESGASKEARAAYQHVLSVKPDDAHAILGLGQCALAEGEAKEALKHFEKLEAGSGQFQGVVLSQTAIAHIMLGEESVAIEKLKLAVETSPKDPLLLSTLESLCKSEGLEKEAKELHQKALKAWEPYEEDMAAIEDALKKKGAL